MAGTLGAFAVARFAGETVRPYWLDLLPADRVIGPLDGGTTLDLAGGTIRGSGYLKADGATVAQESLDPCLQQSGGTDPAACFAQLGVTRSYSDVLAGDHFWTAQIIESAIFVGIAALLVAVGVWLLRKRSL
jgi:hypothetical protein